MDLSPSNFFSNLWISSSGFYVWELLSDIPSYIEKNGTGKKESHLPDLFLENKNQVTIGKNCHIEPGAYIKGPVLIKDNVTIRSGAYIRENSIIGKGSVVGHGTEIKHSILLENVHAAHFSYVGDSILGKEVNLGAGTKCANLRLDRENIYIKYQDKKIDTHRKKLGAIIGDFAQIGCNCVINPGSLIAISAVIPPLSNVKGIVMGSTSHV